jgi:hypothetical protein
MLADRVVLPLGHGEQNMRSIACLLVALGLSASMICAQDQPKFSPAQQEVLDARKARAEAGERRDGSWSRYVADDCIFSDDDGVLLTKAQIMEHGKNWPPPSTTTGSISVTTLSTCTAAQP